jgi:hypothetical protein
MNKSIKCAAMTLSMASLFAAGALAGVLYTNDFQQEALEQVPSSFLVLDGDFAVKQIDDRKVFELPGAPLDSYGALFGPATNGNLTVGARIFGTGRGRRYPTFGVGLFGGSGYKLQVSPAKDALEIYQGDNVLAGAPFKWKTGTWTVLRLRARAAAPGVWRIEGKAWGAGAPEPTDWMVSVDGKTEPTAGRASLWGSPISGTPLRFDDLVLTQD